MTTVLRITLEWPHTGSLSPATALDKARAVLEAVELPGGGTPVMFSAQIVVQP